MTYHLTAGEPRITLLGGVEKSEYRLESSSSSGSDSEKICLLITMRVDQYSCELELLKVLIPSLVGNVADLYLRLYQEY